MEVFNHGYRNFCSINNFNSILRKGILCKYNWYIWCLCKILFYFMGCNFICTYFHRKLTRFIHCLIKKEK